MDIGGAQLSVSAQDHGSARLRAQELLCGSRRRTHMPRRGATPHQRQCHRSHHRRPHRGSHRERQRERHRKRRQRSQHERQRKRHRKRQLTC